MLGKSTDDLRKQTDGESSAGMGDGFGVVVEELDNPEFGTLDVNTGSSRSTVASEETDMSVMFKGDVDIAGSSVGSLRRD